jgi:DNA topoisomerase-1
VQLGEAESQPPAGDQPPAESDNASKSAESAAADQGKGKRKSKPKAKAKAKGPAKPKRISLPRGLDPEMLNLDQAVALLALPRSLGQHPESGEEITAGLGRFGPYLKMGDAYVSLKSDDDVLEIGLNRAVDLLSRARPAKAKGRALGEHPLDGKPVTLKAGRYGPYVEHGKLRATLPAGTDPEALDLERAIAILGAKAPAKPAAGRTSRKVAADEKPAKAKGRRTTHA